MTVQVWIPRCRLGPSAGSVCLCRPELGCCAEYPGVCSADDAGGPHQQVPNPRLPDTCLSLCPPALALLTPKLHPVYRRVTAVAFAGSAAAAAPALSSADDPEMPPLLVTAAADRSIRLWNVGTMQRQRVLYKRPAEVAALAVSRWVLR